MNGSVDDYPRLFSSGGKLLLAKDIGYSGGKARNGLACTFWWLESMVSWLLAKMFERSKDK